MSVQVRRSPASRSSNAHRRRVYGQSALNAQQIEVLSLRNKTNRLEELFVTMVEKNLAQSVSA